MLTFKMFPLWAPIYYYYLHCACTPVATPISRLFSARWLVNQTHLLGGITWQEVTSIQQSIFTFTHRGNKIQQWKCATLGPIEHPCSIGGCYAKIEHATWRSWELMDLMSKSLCHPYKWNVKILRPLIAWRVNLTHPMRFGWDE